MKYTASTIIALAGMSNALPRPQQDQGSDLPSFSLPTPTSGAGSGSNLGDDSSNRLGGLFGGSKLPSLPSATGGAESGLEGLLGGLFGGGKLPNLPGASGTPGSGTGFDLGSLFGGDTLPSLPGASGTPDGGFDLGSLIGGGDGLGGGLTGSRPSDAAPVPSKTQAVAAPSQTGSNSGNTGSSGSIGSNCTPQGSQGGSSENGVTDKNCCTDMTVIFARGTSEPGNVGIVSGPPMFEALRTKLGEDRVTVQGVDYPASAAGNANLGGDGGKKMADLVSQALSQCPDTKIIVAGYSQGAMVVHNAFSNGLSGPEVAGAVQFGDPLKRQAVGDLSTDKVKQFCGTLDQVCGGGGDGGATGGHISYGSSADAAATFAIQAAGLA